MISAGQRLRSLVVESGISDKNISQICEKMDLEGRDWCEKNRSEILRKLSSHCQDKFHRTILRSLFEKSIRSQSEKTSNGEVRRSERIKTEDISFAIGITSSPRENPTVLQCVKSCVNAGFDPVLFSEPDSENVECRTISRKETLGCWGNWIQSIRDLLSLFPSASAIGVFQDDSIFCSDTADFLSEDLWPSKNTGVVSIYNCNHHDHERSKDYGCVKLKTKHILGAVAYIFPRIVAEEISKTEDWQGRRGSNKWKPHERKYVDLFVGMWIHENGLEAYAYKPSLAQHISTHSTLGHGGLKGARISLTFPGENVSAFDAMRSIGYFD